MKNIFITLAIIITSTTITTYGMQEGQSIYLRNECAKPLRVRVNDQEKNPDGTLMLIPTGSRFWIANAKTLKKIEIKTDGSLMYSTLKNDILAIQQCPLHSNAWITVSNTSQPGKIECVRFRNFCTELDTEFLFNRSIKGTVFLNKIANLPPSYSYNRANPNDPIQYSQILKKMNDTCLSELAKTVETWRENALKENNQPGYEDAEAINQALRSNLLKSYNGPRCLK